MEWSGSSSVGVRLLGRIPRGRSDRFGVCAWKGGASWFGMDESERPRLGRGVAGEPCDGDGDGDDEFVSGFSTVKSGVLVGIMGDRMAGRSMSVVISLSVGMRAWWDG